MGNGKDVTVGTEEEAGTVMEGGTVEVGGIVLFSPGFSGLSLGNDSVLQEEFAPFCWWTPEPP